MKHLGLALVVLAAMASPVGAEVMLQIVPSPEGAAPQIRAVVTDVPSLPRSQYALIDDERGVTVTPSSIADFADGRETVALALVVQSNEVMIGNDTFVAAGAPDSFVGYWSAVVNGLEAMDLPHRLPRGSQAMLVTYDDVARRRVEMGPAERLTPASLGTQRDYHGTTGSDLIGGLTTAIVDLSSTHADLKVLVVIGDGNDTDNATFKDRIQMLVSKARAENIHVFSLIYKGTLSEPGEAVRFFARRNATAASGEALSAAMRSVMTTLEKRTTLMFPGEHLVWDGRPRDFTLMIGKDAQDVVKLYTDDPRPPVEHTPWWHSWWKQIAIGLGSVAAVMLLMRLRAGRAA